MRSESLTQPEHKIKRIAIHSAPRSGSSWLGSIFDSHPNVAYKFQPLWSFAFKNSLSENSSKHDIIEFFNRIKDSNDVYVNQLEGKENAIIPTFGKQEIEAVVYKEVRYHYLLENMLTKDEGFKAVGLIRNPLSVLSSWYTAPREFRPDLGWSLEKEWKDAPSKNQNKKEEYNGFNKWVQLTELFLQLEIKYPEKFRVVRYDDLLENPIGPVQQLFEFCDLEFNEQTVRFISSTNKLHSTDPYSVYKKNQTDDKWKFVLPNSIVKEVIDALKSTPLESFLPDESI